VDELEASLRKQLSPQLPIATESHPRQSISWSDSTESLAIPFPLQFNRDSTDEGLGGRAGPAPLKASWFCHAQSMQSVLRC
jgi:hypothetical protein